MERLPKGRFKVNSLGCRTNQYEAQAYRDQLKRMGYVEAAEGEEADLCILNTCTVTHAADGASRHSLRTLVRDHPKAQIVATGCLAERAPELLREIEGVHAVIPNREKEQLLNRLFPEEEIPEFAIASFEQHTRAFVKVQDGCNSFCTYCIIPYVRGRSRSRRVEEIVREVEALIETGYREVVLTGINIGDFDGGGGENLASLVRALEPLEGLARLRLSSIDPDEVDAELQETLLGCSKSCPSLHLVLQSGSNAVLKRMNRKYTRPLFLQTVDRLRAASPDFTFTTDVIVGFPGETEEEFQETLSVLEEVGFAKVHLFPYSARARTRAATFPNQLAPELIQERKERLLAVAARAASRTRERFVGRTMEILTERGGVGHTHNFLPVALEREWRANELLSVKLVGNGPETLCGVPA